MELPYNFWDNFLGQTYDIFQMIWGTGQDLWLMFVRPIREVYLELNGGVVDEITDIILTSIGHYSMIEFMMGGALAIVLLRFLFKLFVPF